MMKRVWIGLGIFIAACSPDEVIVVDGDLTDIPYQPVEYIIPQPAGFPSMAQPSDNIATEAGVELGHFLFFDPILSRDSTQSCSSCHLPELGFTDGKKVSTGITGAQGFRSSMSLVNIGYVNNGLFWDGRSPHLEAQAFLPIEDPTEMDNTWAVVEESLRNHPNYPEMFRKAFGINDKSEITSDLATKALAQYERSLVSANSKYDEVLASGDFGVFSDEELDGYFMFFDIEGSGLPDAQCFHCHSGAYMSVNDFFNNGLDTLGDLTNVVDLGLGEVTGVFTDRGKFRATTLRNIELTAPYMHDGRIETLEEVVDFYNDSIHPALNLDVNLFEGVDLNASQRESLVAFMKTLTDTSYLSNPHFLSPFN